MTITLRIGGKARMFVSEFVSARMLRRTIEISKTINFQDISVKELDIMVEYLVQLFQKQFTVDDVYDGLTSRQLVPTLIGCIQEVVGNLNEETTDDTGSGEEKND